MVLALLFTAHITVRYTMEYVQGIIELAKQGVILKSEILTCIFDVIWFSYTEIFWFFKFIIIPLIVTFSLTVLLDKGIINSYLIHPITRKKFLLLKIIEDLIFLYIIVILSFLTSNIVLIIMFNINNYPQLGLMHYFRLFVDMHIVFIYLLPYYLMGVLIAVIMEESISSFTTYFIITLSESMLIPNILTSGRSISFLTILIALNHHEHLGLHPWRTIYEALTYSVILFIVGVSSLLLSLLILSKKDLT